jgi:hypothetical protein
MGYFRYRFGQGRIPCWLQVCLYYGIIAACILDGVLLDMRVLPGNPNHNPHAPIIWFAFFVYWEIRDYRRYKRAKREDGTTSQVLDMSGEKSR